MAATRFVQALVEVKAENKSDISFPKGAILELINEDPRSGIVTVTFKGKTGQSLSVYFQEAPGGRGTLPPPVPDGPRPIKGKKSNVDREAALRAVASDSLDQLGEVNEAAFNNGVYFPVKYLGYVILKGQMRDYSKEDRQAILHSAVLKCCLLSGEVPKKFVPPTIPDKIQEALGVFSIVLKKESPTTGRQSLGKSNMVDLLITDKDIQIRPPGKTYYLDMFPLANISLVAAGAAPLDHSLCFVCKGENEERVCHVFQSDALSISVLCALGQTLSAYRKAHAS